MKKLLCVFLAAALLLCAAPLSGFLQVDWPTIDLSVFHPRAKAAEIIASGYCGEWNHDYDEVTGEWIDSPGPVWSLDADGILTISGNGTMYDCWDGGTPWYNNRSSVKTVVIETGVTSIGSYAFYDCISLTSVTIPDSVTSIESNAFYGCDILHILCSQNSTAHQYAEANGIAYGLLDVPAEEQTVSGTVGKLNWSLDKLNCVLTVGADGVMPPFVAANAPWKEYANNIHSAVIESGTTTVSKYAFAGLSSLTSVDIPDGVTLIDSYAFYNSRSLESITIPDSVKTIGDSAFDMDESDALGISAGPQDVTIGKGVTSIGSNAFSCCSNIQNVYISDLTAWCRISFQSGAPEESNPLCFGAKLFLNGKELKKLTVPNGITTIKYNAFHGCSSITEVILPTGLKTIGRLAFTLCLNLTSVTIPAGVTSIDGTAFYGCSNLLQATVPDSVTTFGERVFSYCTNLKTAVIGDGIPSLTYTFYDCSSLKTAVIGSSVSSLSRTFSGCSSLESVAVGKSVSRINSGAFANCSSLPRLMLPESVSYIENGAFQNSVANEKIYFLNADCDIQDYSIPADTKLCGYAGSTAQSFADENGFIFKQIVAHGSFGADDDNLTWVLDEDGVLVIAGAGDMNTEADFSPSWLAYKDQIKEALIEQTVTSVAPNAFKGCTALTKVTIPESVTSIGANAFSGCAALPSVTLPESLTSIGTHAFYGCSKLTAVAIPAAVTSLGSGVFVACTGLTKLTVAADNAAYESGGNCVIRKLGKTVVAGCKKSVIPAGVTAIGAEAFRGISGLKTLTIPAGVTAIGNYAFSACTGLTAVAMPETVMTLGASAFNKCTGLTSLQFPQGLTAIGNGAFNGCKKLTALDLPEALTEIGSSAFTGCTGLTEIIFPHELKTVGGSAFKSCAGLVRIVLPHGITDIGASAFSGCAALTDAGYVGTAEDWANVTVGADNAPLEGIRFLRDLPQYCVVTISPVSAQYTGAAIHPAVTVKDGTKTLKKGTDYTVAYGDDCVDVGEHTLTVSGAGGYFGSVTKTFTVTGEKLAAERITLSPAAAVYTGSVQTPVLTVKNAAGETLTEGEDYTVTVPSGRKKPGTYTYTVKGINYYLDTVKKTFTITAQPLDAARVTLSADTFTYNGAVQQPTVTVTSAAGNRLVEGTSYTVRCSSGCKYPGTYTVTLTGQSCYTGTVKKTFTITSQPLDAARVTLSADSFVYNGAVQQPAVTVTSAQGSVLTKDGSYTVSFSSGCKYPGTYTVTVAGKGFYSGTVKKTFTVAPQPLDVSRVTLSADSFVYNGAVQQPAVTVKNAQGGQLTKNGSYTVSYSSGCKYPGAYTVTVTGKNNYTGSVKLTYTIKNRPLDESMVTLSDAVFVYNGKSQKPEVTVTGPTGAALKKDASYTLSFSAGCKAVGVYYVTVTGKGFYTGSVTLPFSIVGSREMKAENVTLSFDEAVYDGRVAHSPAVTVRNDAGLVLTEGKDYTLSVPSGRKMPGQYCYTVTGIGDYEGAAQKTLTVNKQPLAADRVILSAGEPDANGSMGRIVITVKNAAGGVLTNGGSYTYFYTLTEDGRLLLTVTGKGYYTGAVTKEVLL